MLRTGRISKVDNEKGMASVIFEDDEDATTVLLPILQPLVKADDSSASRVTFSPPAIGEYVVVEMAGSSRGVILGAYWNEVNTPQGV